MIDNLLPPGFKDEIFDQSSIEHKYKNIIINIFQSNGYELVKTPLIEYENLVNEHNSFFIKEKNEKKNFILRSDITMQIARLSSARLKNKKRPLINNKDSNNIRKILLERKKIYSKADQKINCDNLSLDQTVNRIIEIYE